MGRLSPELLRSRLAYDHEVVRELRSSILASVRAFGSEQELRAGRDLVGAAAAAGNARLYVVEYAFPILVGAGQTTDRVLVRFDLLAEGNYPHTEPIVTVVSRPLPWSPHVHPVTGRVCLGKGWTPNRTLLAHLVVHVARAFNCDEPDPGLTYSGFNGEAVRYWRTVLKCRPFNELEYPVLPIHLTHGVTDDASSFRPVTSERAAFTPVALRSADGVFAPLSASEEHGTEFSFTPLRVTL